MSCNTDKNVMKVEWCTDHIIKYLEWSIVTKQKFTVKIQEFQIHKLNNKRIFKFKIDCENAKVKLQHNRSRSRNRITEVEWYTVI